MSQPKIYMINDCEWWVANDAESLRDYLRNNGYAISEYGDPLDEPFVVLDDEDMRRLIFVRDTGEEVSFEQQFEETILEGCQIPAMFASTEF